MLEATSTPQGMVLKQLNVPQSMILAPLRDFDHFQIIGKMIRYFDTKSNQKNFC